MKVKKLNASVTNAVADTFSDAVVALADEAKIDDANLAKIIYRLKELSSALTTAIKRDKVASGLDAADARRDEAIRALGTMLEGYAVVPVDAIRGAAQALLSVYGKYGRKVAQAPYDEESSYIESMLEDFAAASLFAHITALSGVEAVLAELRAAEDDFKAKTAAYVKAGAALGESATAIKKQLVACVNDSLVPYVNAVSPLGDAYAAFATELSARMERANASVKKAARTADAAVAGAGGAEA